MQPIELRSNLKLCLLKKVSEQSEWYLCRLFSCSFRAFAFPHMENKCIFRKTEYIFGDFECVSCTGHFYCCCCLSDVCHFGWKVHFPGCQQFIIVFAFVCVRMDEPASEWVSGLKPKPNRCKQTPVRRGDCHLFDVPCSVWVCVFVCVYLVGHFSMSGTVCGSIFQFQLVYFIARASESNSSSSSISHANLFCWLNLNNVERVSFAVAATTLNHPPSCPHSALASSLFVCLL